MLLPTEDDLKDLESCTDKIIYVSIGITPSGKRKTGPKKTTSAAQGGAKPSSARGRKRKRDKP